jgi:hypothetical protein
VSCLRVFSVFIATCPMFLLQCSSSTRGTPGADSGSPDAGSDSGHSSSGDSGAHDSGHPSHDGSQDSGHDATEDTGHDTGSGDTGGPMADSGSGDTSTPHDAGTDSVAPADGGKVTLTGAVAKGPFIEGTSVSVSPVDSSGNTTGTTFSTMTSDNAGDFSVVLSYTGPVQLSANGYYYNEIEGALSGSTLTLNGMASITASGSQNAYINLVTELTFGRIKTLMGGGASIATAVTQADTELYAAFDVGGATFSPGADGTQLNLLGGNNLPSAYLFAASSVVEQAAQSSNISGGTDAKVQSLINQLSIDFSSAGTLTSADAATIATGRVCVEPDSVMASLGARFTSIASTAVVPNINLALDSDGDNVPNATDTCVLLPNVDQSKIPNGICNYEFTTPPTFTSAGGQCIFGGGGGFGGVSGTIIIADFDTANGNDMLTPACTDLYLSLNDGTGTFGTPTALTFPSLLGVTLSMTNQLNVQLLQAADMNHDGKPDLLVEYYTSDEGVNNAVQIVYLPGDGTGHFGSPVTVYAPAACVAKAGACTINAQCCSNVCNTVAGLCGGGGAGSGTPGYEDIAVADLNGDSIPDIAGISSTGSTSSVAVILSGAGTWAPPVPVSLPSGVSVTAMVAADFRSNGDVDLAVATNGNGIYFLPGNGTGVYTAPTTAWTGLGTAVQSLLVLDIDVDTHPDLVATTGAMNGILQIQWGDGTLAPTVTPYTVNMTPAANACVGSSTNSCIGACAIPVAFGDATGDGKPDLVPGALQAVAVNNGDRTFAQAVLIWQAGNQNASTSQNANPLVDMNGDGNADLVLANGGVGGVPGIVLLNQANHFSW